MLLWLLRKIGSSLGSLAFTLGVRRQVTVENIARAFPEWSSGECERLARASYRNLGRVFFEFPYLRYSARSAVRNGLQINNLEMVSAAITASRGAILLSGHIANWEWLALGCGAQLQAPLDVVIKNQRSGFAERFMVAMRTRFGNRMVNAGDVRAIFRALGNGEILAILGDQAPPAESVQVEFFGRMVPTFEGTARLALHAKVPIFFLQPYEITSNGYRSRFIEVETADLKGATAANIRELTQRHTSLLEQAIREKPELWLWQHRRWKNTSS